VRLALTPLEHHQVLMDYDVELQAVDGPVVFGDKRDGGLLVRVAGTMTVEDEKGNKGAGTILNSRGDKNADTWGKRAEWADYSGPDASGKTVGIAMFDHPANLRFPTHWHARTYGLMTANRFGTDHFKGNYGDHKTVICAPSKGANCPACASHTGDYTIPAGQSITLRHRFFFHQGDAVAGHVAEQYAAYTADPDAQLGLMRAMHQERKWKELITQFGGETFAAWPTETALEALQLRGQIYSFTKDGSRAEADLQTALKLAPPQVDALLLLADNYVNNLNDDPKAIAAYQEVIAITGTNSGWQPLTATVSLAKLYTDALEFDSAHAVLKPYGDLSQLACSWRVRLLRAFGHLYAAQGKEPESLAKFREALSLETSR
jgi:hypothetical protein